MGFSIEEFKGLVSNGGGMARANLFNIYLPALDGNTRSLSMLCKAAALPGKQMMSQDVQMGMNTRKIANGFATTDVSLTFYVLNDYAIRDYFENWQKLVVSDSYEVGYYNDYTKSVTIENVQKRMSTSLYKKKLFNNSEISQALLGELDNTSIGPFNLLTGELDLQVGGKNHTTYKVELLEAYPTTIGELTLSSEADGLMELTVELSYRDYTTLTNKPKGQFDALISGLIDIVT